MILDVESVIVDLEGRNRRDLAFLTLLAGMGDDLPDAIRRLRNAGASAREWGAALDGRRESHSKDLARRVEEISARAAGALENLAEREASAAGAP